MIPDKDYYADKDGKLTDDPEKYATQVAVKGFELDERIARRFGIVDRLVSADEPGAVRPVRGKASVTIEKADEEPETAKPETDEPEAEESKAAASRAAAKDEGGKKKK